MRAFLMVAALAASVLGTDLDDMRITISDSSIAELEPASGSLYMDFRAVLSYEGDQYFGVPPKFTWRTENGGAGESVATPGQDYTPSGDQDVEFASSTSGSIAKFSVTILNDDIQENTETFSVSIVSSNVGSFTPQATGLITDTEGLTIVVSDDAQTEGKNDYFHFNVRPSHEVSTDVQVYCSTKESSTDFYAQAQVDYVPKSGELLTFVPGGVFDQQFSVQILNDDVQEHMETFEVQVESNKFLASGKGTGVFKKELEGVTICIDSLVAEEDDASQTGMIFNVRVSHTVDTDFDINVRTTPGTASLSTDGITGHYQFNGRKYEYERGSPPLSDTFRVEVNSDDVQSTHSYPSNDDQPGFGPVDFQVEYDVDYAVFMGSIGGAENDWQVSTCGGERIDSAFGMIYDFEDATVYVKDAETIGESDTDKWVFEVILSHQTKTSTTHESPVSFMYSDLNQNSSPANQVATVETHTPPGGCASLPSALSATVDACWPLGVVPGETSGSFATTSAIKATFDHGPKDVVAEGDETFAMAIQLDDDSARIFRLGLTKGYGVATITDDEVLTAIIHQGPNTAEGTNSHFVFSVALSHTPGKSGTKLSWETISGDISNTNVHVARPNLDYAQTNPVSIEWAVDSTAQVYKQGSVAILDDEVAEVKETFAVRFSQFDGDFPINNLDAERGFSIENVITDDEKLTLSIHDMTVPQYEDETNWDFVVSLSHAVSGMISFPWRTAEAVLPNTDITKARLGQRFKFQDDRVVFPADPTGKDGPSDSTLKLTSVKNDDIQWYAVDSVQRFDIVVQTAAEPLISASQQHSNWNLGAVLIKDNENPTLSVKDAIASEARNANMLFSIYLSHQISTATKVVYTTEDGSASTAGLQSDGGFDYTPAVAGTNPGTVTIPRMNPVKSPISARVPVRNDAVQELEETFTLIVDETRSAPHSGIVFTRPHAEGLIFDDEGVTVRVDDATGPEDGGALTFTVKLSHTSSTPVNISYTLTGVTALFGPRDDDQQHDFVNSVNNESSRSSFVMVGGHNGAKPTREGTINVTLVDDNIQETTEHFTVGLDRVNSPRNWGISTSEVTATGFITDEENVIVSIESPAGVQPKADSSSMTFVLKLSHQVSSDLAVSYKTSPGSASPYDLSTDRGDYVHVERTVKFPQSNLLEGWTPADSNTDVHITIFRDMCVQENEEDFYVELTVPTMDTLPYTITNSPGRGILSDNITADVTIDDATASEAQGASISFPVKITHCITDPVVLRWDTNDGTAREGQHFTLSGTPLSRVVTFTQSVEERAISIPLKNDNIQGPDTTFSVELSWQSNPYGSFVNWGPNGGIATGTIEDFENVMISITPCVAEHATSSPFVFDIEMSHALDTELKISYATTDVTAQCCSSDPDYVQVAETEFIFSPGTVNSKFTQVPVQVMPKNDSFRPSGPAAVKFNLNLDVIDEDVFASHKISFLNDLTSGKGAILGKDRTKVSVPAISGTEGNNFVFTAILADNYPDELVIQVTPVEIGSLDPSERARANFDFVATPYNFTFKANGGINQEVKFPIQVMDDWLQERTEKFSLFLKVIEPEGLPDGSIDFTEAQLIHDIVDNDKATIMVADLNCSESPGGPELNPTLDFQFHVTLSHYVYTDVTADLQFASGTAQMDRGPSIPMKSPTKDFWVAPNRDMRVIFQGSQEETNSTGGITVPFDVTILNDDYQERHETFTLEITSVSDIVTPGILVGTATILDDENSNVTISEVYDSEGELFSFMVTLSHKAHPQLLLNLKTEDDSAVADINYEATNATLIFSGDQVESFFDVQTLENPTVQGNSTFYVEVESQVPDHQGYDISLMGTGIIADIGSANITVEAVSASESAEEMVFTLRLSHDVDQTVEVAWATVDSNQTGEATSDPAAQPSPDFESASGVVTFLGQADEVKTFTVNLVDDVISEPDEKIVIDFNITSPSGYAIDVVDLDAGFISDNEFPSLSVSEVTVGFNEEPIAFTVFMSHKLQGSFDFMYATVDTGSATSVDSTGQLVIDYIAEDSTFTMNESMIEPPIAVITIDVVDDVVAEIEETFGLEVTDVEAPGYEISLPGDIGIGKIIDNEDATIMIIPAMSTSETEGADGVLQVPVTLSHNAQPQVQVRYTFIDLSATCGVEGGNKDYDCSSEVTPVMFEPNERRQYVEVQINDDWLTEDDELFCIVLMNIEPPSVAVFPQDGGRDSFISIVDDFEHATISVSDASNEDDNLGEGVTLTFRTEMSHGAQFDVFASGRLTMNWTTSDSGSAVAGEDYEATTGTVEFASTIVQDAQSPIPRTNIQVNTFPDQIQEDTEIFEVLLEEPVFSGDFRQVNFTQITLSNTKAIGHINSAIDENATISIDDTEGLESDEVLTFTVHLSHEVTNSFDLEWKTTSVDPSLSPYAAKPNVDYKVDSGVITFDANEPPVDGSIIRTIPVEVYDDAIVQGRHEFIVELIKPAGSSNPIQIKQAEGTGFIIDDDSATVEIEDASAEETGFSLEDKVQMTFQAKMSNEVDGVTSFVWKTTDLEAESGQDYEEVSDAEFEFPSNVVAGVLSVVILNDYVQEGVENFQVDAGSLFFRNPGIQTVQWDKQTALGTITDDEGSTVWITDDETNEKDVDTDFFVFLSHQIRIANMVSFDIEDGTATAGEDYTTDSKSISFSTDCWGDNCQPGPVKAIPFTIIDDEISEALVETITITLTTATPPVIRLEEGRKEASLSIVDDDAATVFLSNPSQNEAVTPMVFVATLSHTVDTEVRIAWATTNAPNPDGLPTTGVAFGTQSGNREITGDLTIHPDFINTAGSVGIPASEKSTTLEVPIVDDWEQECDELLEVDILTVGAGIPVQQYRVSKANETEIGGVGTLIDDNETVVLFIKDHEDSEGETFAFEASLTHSLDRETSFVFSTHSGNINRYEPLSNEVKNFGLHSTALQYINVETTDDEIAQESEDFSLTASVQTACGFTIEIVDGVGTIDDNEDATLSVLESGFDENKSGDFEVQVRFSHALAVETTVNWSVNFDGNANEDDLGATSGSFALPPSDDPQSGVAKISVVADEIVELDETFTLEIDSTVPGVSTTFFSNTVTIKNPDMGEIRVESQPSEAPQFDFTMTLTHNVDTVFDVKYTAIATIGGDVVPNTVSVAFDGRKGEQQTGSVTIVEDEMVEGSETFQVDLEIDWLTSQPRTVGFDTENDDHFFGTIISDDVAIISCEDVTAPESDETIAFTVTLSHAVDTEVSVDYATESDSAVEDEDFEKTSGTVVFPTATEGSSQQVDVVVYNDEICDGDEVFGFVLSNIQASGRSVQFPFNGNAHKAEGTLLDMTGTQVQIIDATSRAGDPMDFQVTLSNACDYTISLEFSTIAGSATEDNYQPLESFLLTIPPNSLTATVSVQTIPNDGQATAVTFGNDMSKASGTERGVQLTRDTATGSITPAVTATVSFVQLSATGTEGTSLSFEPSLSNPLNVPLEVSFSTADLSAVAGTHYNSTVKTVTFAAGETTATPFMVPLLSKDGWQPNLNFTACLGLVVPNEDIGVGPCATGIREDREEPRIVVDEEISVLAGPEGSVLIVWLKLNTQLDINGGSLTVNINTADGTAKVAAFNYDEFSATQTLSYDAPLEIRISTGEVGIASALSFSVDVSTDRPEVKSDLPASLTILPAQGQQQSAAQLYRKASACGGSVKFIMTNGVLDDDMANLNIPASRDFSTAEVPNNAWDYKVTFDAKKCFWYAGIEPLTFATAATMDTIKVTLDGSMVTVYTTEVSTGGQISLTATSPAFQETITINVGSSASPTTEILGTLASTGVDLTQGEEWCGRVALIKNTSMTSCVPEVGTANILNGVDCCQAIGSSTTPTLCQRIQVEAQAKQVTRESMRVCVVANSTGGENTICLGSGNTLDPNFSSSNCIEFRTVQAPVLAPFAPQHAIAGETLSIPFSVMHVMGTPIVTTLSSKLIGVSSTVIDQGSNNFILEVVVDDPSPVVVAVFVSDDKYVIHQEVTIDVQPKRNCVV